MNHVFNHLVSNQADDCSGVSTVLEIGFELLPAEVDADGIIQSLIDNRMNRLEVLVAGLLDLSETFPPAESVHQIQAVLYGLAAMLDERPLHMKC